MTTVGTFKAFQDGFIGEEDLYDALEEADGSVAEADTLFAVLANLIDAIDNDTQCHDTGPTYAKALEAARLAVLP